MVAQGGEEAIFIRSRAESSVVRGNILVIILADVRIDRGRLPAGVLLSPTDHKIRLPALDQLGDILLGLPAGPIVADNSEAHRWVCRRRCRRQSGSVAWIAGDGTAVVAATAGSGGSAVGNGAGEGLLGAVGEVDRVGGAWFVFVGLNG